MSLPSISHHHLQKIITQLDQALYNHKEWYRLLIRSLVCHSSCDQHDLAPDAHKQCRFGQWYYNHIDKNLLGHPRFVAIGTEHEHMHGLAKQLLKNNIESESISTHDYDSFSNSLDRFQFEMLALKHELEELIYYRDPLTKAINRLYMLPVLQEQLAFVKRQVYPVSCLVMMDLDHFSEINNVYGHTAGDKVLAATVHYLLAQLRSYDKLFRYGGEEFLLLLPNVTLDKAHDLIERLRTGLAHLNIDIGHKKTVRITSSFGIAPLTAKHTVEYAIEQADKAVYAAKSAGRNCVQIANK